MKGQNVYQITIANYATTAVTAGQMAFIGNALAVGAEYHTWVDGTSQIIQIISEVRLPNPLGLAVQYVTTPNSPEVTGLDKPILLAGDLLLADFATGSADLKDWGEYILYKIGNGDVIWGIAAASQQDTIYTTPASTARNRAYFSNGKSYVSQFKLAQQNQGNARSIANVRKF
jgi:hypothetical protein